MTINSFVVKCFDEFIEINEQKCSPNKQLNSRGALIWQNILSFMVLTPLWYEKKSQLVL